MFSLFWRPEFSEDMDKHPLYLIDKYGGSTALVILMVEAVVVCLAHLIFSYYVFKEFLMMISGDKKCLSDNGVILHPGMPVLVRNHLIDTWRVNVFSHCEDCESGKYCCADGNVYRHCMTLNGNEDLEGTTAPVYIVDPEENQSQKPDFKTFAWGDHVRVWNDATDSK